MRSISAFDRAVNTIFGARCRKFRNACFANPATGACDQNGFPDKSIAQSLVNMGHADHGTGRENHATP